MIYKKTFLMNVFFAVAWVLLCLLSFATDIDYEEHTLKYKIFTALIQLFILSTAIITATHLYRLNKPALHKFAIVANSCCFTGSILYLFVILYYQPSILTSVDFLIILFVYFIFIMPFLVNVKIVKKAQL